MSTVRGTRRTPMHFPILHACGGAFLKPLAYAHMFSAFCSGAKLHRKEAMETQCSGDGGVLCTAISSDATLATNTDLMPSPCYVRVLFLFQPHCRLCAYVYIDQDALTGTEACLCLRGGITRSDDNFSLEAGPILFRTLDRRLFVRVRAARAVKWHRRSFAHANIK